MHPKALIKQAQELSPVSWKGQQTVIRRLSRTQHLPQATMHDLLRTAAKQFSQSSRYSHASTPFCSNKDTPSDLRAEYLATPYVYGLKTYKEKLAWMREVAHGTLMKTQHHVVATHVLFERDRPEAKERFRKMLKQTDSHDLAAFKRGIISQKWSSGQLDLMQALVNDPNLNIWYNDLDFLDHYAEQALSYCEGPTQEWFANKVSSFRMNDTLRSFKSIEMQHACLVQLFVGSAALFSYRDPAEDTIAMQQSCYGEFKPLDTWYSHQPTPERCLYLAQCLDTEYQKRLPKDTQIELDWVRRDPWMLGWVALLGATPEKSQEALDLYHSVDASLLSFSTIAQGLYAPKIENINNMSDLLCP